MTFTEALKRTFFKIPKDKEDLSIPVSHPGIETDLVPDNYSYNITQGFFDNDPFMGNRDDKGNNLTTQNNIIREYRKTAILPEVSNAIDEIVNEAAFVNENSSVVYLDFSDKFDITDKLKNAIIDCFDEVLDAMDFNYNVDNLLRRFYIDGQLITSLSYDNNKMKKGIQKINVMSPYNFMYDEKIKMYRYFDFSSIMSTPNPDQIKQMAFNEEEIIRIDSGLYDGKMILSHLQSAIKIANQLQTIEDLVIPLRFSRSMSRRVFNVDVGDLTPAKIRQEMEAIKREYKYKKYYDIEKGSMSNTSNVMSIVEDYWFPNRSGRGGTTFDVMNETGGISFGDMGDAEYFRNKLYEALKVPLGRLSGGANKSSFDFTATAVENDEVRFFAFINRLRQRFNLFLVELLRRQLSAKGIMNNLEFDRYKNIIQIKWERENNILEREKIDILKQRLELYSTFKEYEGDIYSRKWILKNILKMSDEEIEQMQQEIRDELKTKVDKEDTDINNTDASELEPEENGEEKPEETEEKPEETEEAPEELDKEFGSNMNASEPEQKTPTKPKEEGI